MSLQYCKCGKLIDTDTDSLEDCECQEEREDDYMAYINQEVRSLNN